MKEKPHTGEAVNTLRELHNGLKRLLGGVAVVFLGLGSGCSYLQEPESDAVVIIKAPCVDPATGKREYPYIQEVLDRNTGNSQNGMSNPDITRITCLKGSVLDGTLGYGVVPFEEYDPTKLEKGDVALVLKDVLGEGRVRTIAVFKDENGNPTNFIIGTNATAEITAAVGGSASDKEG